MLIQYGGATYGMVRLYKDKFFMYLVLLLLSIAYLWAVAGVLGSYRYKLPVIPFICIAAAYGYVYLMSEKQKKQATKLPASL